MKFLREEVDPQETEIITETVGSEKTRFITGPFLMFDKQNRNGRVYPQSIMDEAVGLYRKNFIDTNRALGELNHPAGRVQVDPERACVMITEMKKDGNYYMGKAKVLSTPLGKLVECLLNDGVRLGVSSRGIGSVVQRGLIKEVKNDYRITAGADVVHDPSVENAFVESLMEQKEYMVINGVIVEKDYDRLQRIKSMKPSKEYQQAILEQFRNILSGM